MTFMNNILEEEKTVEPSWLDSPLFVLGYSKSGTSLLVGILDNHPQLVVLPEESDYFDAVYEPASRFARSTKLTKKEQVDFLVNLICDKTHLRNFKRGKVENDIGGNFNYEKFDTENFRQHVRQYLNKHDINPAEVMKSISYAFYQASELSYNNIKLWIEKTPYHQKFLKERYRMIQEMFKDFRVIHIVRDPRDNYLAYKKKWPKLTVADFCYEWKRVFDITQSLHNTSKNLTIKYEDLVSQPEKTLKAMTKFLGIDYSENLEVPSKYGNVWHGNSMFGEKHQGISKKNLGRFRSLTDKTEISQIEHTLQKPMEIMGYTPEAKALDNSQISQQWLNYTLARTRGELRLKGKKLKYKLAKFKR